MNSRVVTTLVLAVVLIGVVMCATTAMTFVGVANDAKFAAQRVRSHPLASANSMNIIDLTGDGENDLFAQADHILAVYDEAGTQIVNLEYDSGMATTMGDVNADGVEDIVVFDTSGVFALTGEGEVLWQANPDDAGQPYRAAVVRFPSGRQVVLGDDRGQVIALDGATGRELWRGDTSVSNYIRGLDEADINRVRHVAVANHNGMVKLFDENGSEVWTYQLSGLLRRMRAYDLDGDGTSEVIVGGDGNRLVMLDAASGSEIINTGLGQRIVEVREVEFDGDPSSREFAVGGRDGGVWAFSAAGVQLWSATRDDRVTQIAGLDIDDDGRQEVLIGYESGRVDVFNSDGQRFLLGNWQGPITRLDAGRMAGSVNLALADRDAIYLLNVRMQRAPFVYTPLVAGLLLSLLIAFAAWFIATLPQKPAIKLRAEDQSLEGLMTRHRMLHESLADVERMRGSHEMPAGAYIERLKELRGDLADTQAALIAKGQSIRVETFNCPKCGGALPLGLDKCDYCGQIVIV